jgi:hypothetical protein
MKNFTEVIKLKIVPTIFIFHCSLCGLEITDYDRHFGLIKMNKHLIDQHPGEILTLDKEELYSRKPAVSLESF